MALTFNNSDEQRIFESRIFGTVSAIGMGLLIYGDILQVENPYPPITDWLPDYASTLMLSSWLCCMNTRDYERARPLDALVASSLFYGAIETLQLIPSFPGVFDPKDYIAYVAGGLSTGGVAKALAIVTNDKQ